MAAPETSGAQTNGTQSTQPRSALDADIALLQSLLSQEHNDEPESDLDVAEILKRLETADGIAAGLESRLDGIMGSIDSMLGALEPREQTVERESAVVGQGDVAVEAARVVTTDRPEEGEQK